ncbi:MAG: hypothetical protein MJE66_25080, partial [Proteobacteria bacterium]|nr:hypothetical protein [Pseudomonadota bacterium]
LDLAAGVVCLSDRSREPLDPASLHVSPIDGAWLCRVKRDLDPAGLLARFTHAAQAELLNAVEFEGEQAWVPLAGRRLLLPDL